MQVISLVNITDDLDEDAIALIRSVLDMDSGIIVYSSGELKAFLTAGSAGDYGYKIANKALNRVIRKYGPTSDIIIYNV